MKTYIIALNTVPKITHNFMHGCGSWGDRSYVKQEILKAVLCYVFGFITHKQLFL